MHRSIWKAFPCVVCAAAVALTVASGPVRAASTAPGITLESVISSGLSQPLYISAPAGDGRLFVVEKGGSIKLYANGALLATPYLDISAKVDPAGEGGLLGLAFDPAYATNGRFYVNYIDKTTRETVVARYTVSSNPNVADAGSGATILTVPQPAGLTNHKAGWIGFRPGEPGNLYIATGDGGGANDPGNRAQNLNDNLGKILRVTPLAGGGYTVPADNPFVGVAGNDEIWAYGLRNPYRNSFDRASGALYIADVGQSTREEIDIGVAGANYGWRAREGKVDNPGVGDAAPSGAVDPIFDYAHTSAGGLGDSIIGGYVYRGGANALLEGRYVFGDYVSGRVYRLDPSGGSFVATLLVDNFLPNRLSSFGEDGFGGLYVVDINGTVYRLAGAVPEPSTWAMMLAALGILAVKMRRRRAVNRAR